MSARLARRMTMSLYRFDEKQDFSVVHTFNPPAKASHASYRLDDVLTSGEMPRCSQVFCVLASFTDVDQADAAYEEAEEMITFQQEPIESAHLLLRPLMHRGESNWLDPSVVEPMFATDAADRPSSVSPLLVVTTAGFHDLSTTPPERLARFVQHTAQVREAMSDVEGMIFRQLFSADEAFLYDGLTLSVWRDLDSMLTFAYKPSEHKSRLDVQYGEAPFFDRSSFSRFVIEKAQGNWEGHAMEHLLATPS